jgi:hypothetical protein
MMPPGVIADEKAEPNADEGEAPMEKLPAALCAVGDKVRCREITDDDDDDEGGKADAVVTPEIGGDRPPSPPVPLLVSPLPKPFAVPKPLLPPCGCSKEWGGGGGGMSSNENKGGIPTTLVAEGFTTVRFTTDAASSLGVAMMAVASPPLDLPPWCESVEDEEEEEEEEEEGDLWRREDEEDEDDERTFEEDEDDTKGEEAAGIVVDSSIPSLSPSPIPPFLEELLCTCDPSAKAGADAASAMDTAGATAGETSLTAAAAAAAAAAPTTTPEEAEVEAGTEASSGAAPTPPLTFGVFFLATDEDLPAGGARGTLLLPVLLALSVSAAAVRFFHMATLSAMGLELLKLADFLRSGGRPPRPPLPLPPPLPPLPSSPDPSEGLRTGAEDERTALTKPVAMPMV